MKKISAWGRQHPWKARIIIVTSHVLFILLALYAGRSLWEMELQLPAGIMYGLMAVYLFAAITYPRKKDKTAENRNAFYIRQKSRDFLLLASTFGMVLIFSNNPGYSFAPMQPLFASSAISVIKEKPTAAEILESLKHRDKSSLTRMEKRILKQEFKKQLKTYALASIQGKKEARDNAGLVILAIVGAIGLLALVAMLACNISCSGSDGGAIVVGLLGTAAVIIGLVLVLRSIKRKNAKKTEVPET